MERGWGEGGKEYKVDKRELVELFREEGRGKELPARRRPWQGTYAKMRRGRIKQASGDWPEEFGNLGIWGFGQKDDFGIFFSLFCQFRNDFTHYSPERSIVRLTN